MNQRLARARGKGSPSVGAEIGRPVLPSTDSRSVVSLGVSLTKSTYNFDEFTYE